MMKAKSAVLSLVLLASCMSTASASPSASIAAESPAGATKECAASIKKMQPELNKLRSANGNAVINIPNCGTLEGGLIEGEEMLPTADDLAAIKAQDEAKSDGNKISDVSPESIRCRDVGGFSGYRNIFGSFMWKVTTRMHWCYNDVTETIRSYQTPQVTLYAHSGYRATIVSREAAWEDYPWSAMGNTTSLIEFARIFDSTVQHQVEVFGNGAWGFWDWT